MTKQCKKGGLTLPHTLGYSLAWQQRHGGQKLWPLLTLHPQSGRRGWVWLLSLLFSSFGLLAPFLLLWRRHAPGSLSKKECIDLTVSEAEPMTILVGGREASRQTWPELRAYMLK